MRLTGRAGFALAVCCAVILTGCESGSGYSPAPAAPTNISGDYSGSITDSVAGTGTATATLAQSGRQAGGQITFAPAGGTQTLNVSMTIASTNALAGSMVVDYASGTTCTFNVSGTYASSTGILSGSYSAVTNCSGQSGTFSLTQQCTDTVTSHARRDKVGGTAPC